MKVFNTTAVNDGDSNYCKVYLHPVITGFDIVSAAPCLPGDELQQLAHGSSGLLVHSVPPAAHQDPTYQPAVHPETGYQPGYCPAHSPILSLHSIQGKVLAVAY